MVQEQQQQQLQPTTATTTRSASLYWWWRFLQTVVVVVVVVVVALVVVVVVVTGVKKSNTPTTTTTSQRWSDDGSSNSSSGAVVSPFSSSSSSAVAVVTNHNNTDDNDDKKYHPVIAAAATVVVTDKQQQERQRRKLSPLSDFINSIPRIDCSLTDQVLQFLVRILPRPSYCRQSDNAYNGSSEIKALYLVNTDTNQKFPLINGTQIVLDRYNIRTLPPFNILADYDKACFDSVRFGYNRTLYSHVDTNRFCGGERTNGCKEGPYYNECKQLRRYGTHTVSATPRLRLKGRWGRIGKTMTVTFSIVPFVPNATQLQNLVLSSNSTSTTTTTIPIPVNVTVQSITLDFMVTATATKGLQSILVSVYKPNTTELNSLPLITAFVNQTTTLLNRKVSLRIPRYIPPGMYPLQVQLTDADNDRNVWTSNDLSRNGWPSSIQIVNTIVDATDPLLIQLVQQQQQQQQQPLVTLYTAKTQGINYTVSAQDDLSGMSHGFVQVYYAQTSRNLVETRFDFVPIAGTPGVVVVVGNATILLPPSAYAGIYNLNVILVDVVGNNAVYDTNKLAKLGFPSKLIVVN